MKNLFRPLQENEESLVISAQQVDKAFKQYIYNMVENAGWQIIKQPKCLKPWTSSQGSFAMEIPKLSTTVELKYEWGIGNSAREKWFSFPSLIAWAVRKKHLTTKRSILVIHVDTRIDLHKGGLEDEMPFILEVKEQCKFMSTKKHEILALTVAEFNTWLDDMNQQ